MKDKGTAFLISLSFVIILFPSMLEILYTQPTKNLRGKSLLFLLNFSGFLNLLFYSINLIFSLNLKRKIVSSFNVECEKEKVSIGYLLFFTNLFSGIYNGICCIYFWKCRNLFLEEYFNTIFYFLLFNIFIVDTLIIIVILYILHTIPKSWEVTEMRV